RCRRPARSAPIRRRPPGWAPADRPGETPAALPRHVSYRSWPHGTGETWITVRSGQRADSGILAGAGGGAWVEHPSQPPPEPPPSILAKYRNALYHNAREVPCRCSSQTRALLKLTPDSHISGCGLDHPPDTPTLDEEPHR